jgi:chromosome segregation ATPase
MLITLISGMLFYRNLTQIGPSKSILKVDFDELRTLDLQVYSTTLFLRQNLSADLSELKDENTRIKELLDILVDLNKNIPELKDSIAKINTHFSDKRKKMDAFEVALKDLRSNASALMPTYNLLDKNNIKFILDKKDFYRECILDSYMYIAFSQRENENRLTDDQKVLSQILAYAPIPNPDLQKYSYQLESIHKRVKEIDSYMLGFKEVSIVPEMKVIAKYYQESLQAQNDKNEGLLTIMFIAIGVYLLFMIFILRKD